MALPVLASRYSVRVWYRNGVNVADIVGYAMERSKQLRAWVKGASGSGIRMIKTRTIASRSPRNFVR